MVVLGCNEPMDPPVIIDSGANQLEFEVVVFAANPDVTYADFLGSRFMKNPDGSLRVSTAFSDYTSGLNAGELEIVFSDSSAGSVSVGACGDCGPVCPDTSDLTKELDTEQHQA